MASIATVPAHARRALRTHPGTVAGAGFAAVCMTMFIVICPLNSLVQTNDFVSEAWRSYQLLAHGEVGQSLHAAPSYYGSLMLRAPLGFLGAVLSHGWRLAYLLSALPCIAAPAILGAWLTSERGPAARASQRARWLSPLGVLLAVNPVFLYCVALGHPEDVLSGVLAITAVILASRGVGGWSMVLVSLAAFDKPWALAVVPVAFAVLPGRHVRSLGVLVLTSGILFVPTTLLRSSVTGAAGSLTSGAAGIFYPQQLWWWFGDRAWVSVHAHEIIVATGFVCSALWWVTHRGRRLSRTSRLREGLLLLALVLLLRAVMDPWNNLYYELPFLLTLYALYAERPPLLLLVVTAALFLLTMPLNTTLLVTGKWPDADFYALLYQLATVPMIAVFCVRLFAPHRLWLRLRPRLASLL